jgi:demethylmenaquinone methyltransferase / 2-methoxy-6-polyprenyl-1,4-benzoquinol methylase
MSRQVHDMFARIAPRYDRANAVLSLGVHHWWRRRTVRASGVGPGAAVLDCATGTGDLAIAFKRRVGAGGRVVGTDFCADMLAFGIGKARRRGMDIAWEVQDAMQLTYAHDSFDAASIAFGIRNVDDPSRALRSMAGVVKPGGTVLVLEFGRPLWWMKPFFKLYSAVVIPLLGGLLTGDRDAYAYLTRTSAAFPTGGEFLALMRDTGAFASVRCLPLTGGIAYLYVGKVL